MAVRTIRVAQTVDREMETRWFKLPWYLTRWEFCYAAVGTLMAVLTVFISWGAEPALVAFAVLLPTGMYAMARWKRSNPEPSYIWDTFYRLALIPERARWLKRRRRPFRFVPDVTPARSVFAGTTRGGLALTEPWQRDGLPTFCPLDDAGAPRPPVLPWRPLVRPRRRAVAVERPGPGPLWFALAEAPAWDAEVDDDTRRRWQIRPTMAMTVVYEEVADA